MVYQNSESKKIINKLLLVEKVRWDITCDPAHGKFWSTTSISSRMWGLSEDSQVTNVLIGWSSSLNSECLQLSQKPSVFCPLVLVLPVLLIFTSQVFSPLSCLTQTLLVCVNGTDAGLAHWEIKLELNSCWIFLHWHHLVWFKSHVLVCPGYHRFGVWR